MEKSEQRGGTELVKVKQEDQAPAPHRCSWPLSDCACDDVAGLGLYFTWEVWPFLAGGVGFPRKGGIELLAPQLAWGR